MRWGVDTPRGHRYHPCTHITPDRETDMTNASLILLAEAASGDPFRGDLAGATVRMTGTRPGRIERVTDDWVVRKSSRNWRHPDIWHHSLIRVKDGMHRIAKYSPTRNNRELYDFGDIHHHHGAGRVRLFREGVTMEVVG